MISIWYEKLAWFTHLLFYQHKEEEDVFVHSSYGLIVPLRVVYGGEPSNQYIYIWCSQIFSLFFCWSKIFDWIFKNNTIFLKICLNEMPKRKTNRSMIISMVRAFHPINNWISIFTRLVNTIQRRHYDHNCSIIIAWPCIVESPTPGLACAWVYFDMRIGRLFKLKWLDHLRPEGFNPAKFSADSAKCGTF